MSTIRTFEGRASAYLQLTRFPNIFTAVADILAGYLIAGGGNVRLSDLVLLSLASASIYAGGCVSNDICDREIDARERPLRPIPSGEVSLEGATVFAAGLFTLGLFSAARVGWFPFFYGLLLVFAAVGYNAFTKNRKFAGPVNMAACRSLNLLLGMSSGSVPTVALTFPIVTLLYVFAITVLSQFETGGTLGKRGSVILTVWMLTIAFPLFLILRGDLGFSAGIYTALLVFFTGPVLMRAAFGSDPLEVGSAVKAMILCIPVLDAVFASGVLGMSFGIPVALLSLPPVYLSRTFYVT